MGFQKKKKNPILWVFHNFPLKIIFRQPLSIIYNFTVRLLETTLFKKSNEQLEVV